jgi:CBS domain-containing membrane protein
VRDGDRRPTAEQVAALVAHLLGSGPLACGCAVGLAIAAMSLTRSLHPPGGAVALTAVLLGPDGVPEGWWSPLVPLGMNAVVLVAAGWALLRLTGHTYPHAAAPHPPRRDPLPSERVGLREEDVDAVLADVGETFDIDTADLRALVLELERRVLAREREDLTCAAIMSRDLITVAADTHPSVARARLLESGVRLLPVVDHEGRPVGAVGLRELARPAHAVADVMTKPVVTGPSRSAAGLIGPLTDGHRHAALVVDDDGRLIGLVSQADLLAALARPSAVGS